MDITRSGLKLGFCGQGVDEIGDLLLDYMNILFTASAGFILCLTTVVLAPQTLGIQNLSKRVS
jgi:hypothetical protein